MSASTKQAWTPGPWYASGNCVHFANGTEAEGNRSAGTICEVFARAERQRANAKLIAKVPESTLKLLEFYEAAKSWHSVHGHDKNSVQCDEFCRLMKESEPILREAGAL